MEDAEKAWNQQASRELVAFMSIKTMFADPELRALARAAKAGRTREIDRIVANGVDVNAKGTGNGTVLFWGFKNLKGFEKLLELGADPNARFLDGGTIMHWAVEMDDPAFLKAAIKHGGNPDLTNPVPRADNEGRTPIFDAIVMGNLAAVQALVEAGADINARVDFGYTPLIKGIMDWNFEAALFLLDSGADYSLKTDNGKDAAAHLAQRRTRLSAGDPGYNEMNRLVDWFNARGVRVQ